jgi:hypothetical protein
MLSPVLAGWKESMGTVQANAAPPVTEDVRNHLLERYDTRIAYYWKTSQSNKHSYKATRYLVTILGALVTLVSSLASASFVKDNGLTIAFAVLTPLLAASMAIVGGVSQAFQWGAAWSDAVITATRLEKERDRIAVTPIGQLDPLAEMGRLDDTVLA